MTSASFGAWSREHISILVFEILIIYEREREGKVVIVLVLLWFNMSPDSSGFFFLFEQYMYNYSGMISEFTRPSMNQEASTRLSSQSCPLHRLRIENLFRPGCSRAPPCKTIKYRKFDVSFWVKSLNCSWGSWGNPTQPVTVKGTIFHTSFRNSLSNHIDLYTKGRYCTQRNIILVSAKKETFPFNLLPPKRRLVIKNIFIIQYLVYKKKKI